MGSQVLKPSWVTIASNNDCAAEVSHAHEVGAQQMQLFKIEFLRPRKHSQAPWVAVSRTILRPAHAPPHLHFPGQKGESSANLSVNVVAIVTISANST